MDKRIELGQIVETCRQKEGGIFLQFPNGKGRKRIRRVEDGIIVDDERIILFTPPLNHDRLRIPIMVTAEDLVTGRVQIKDNKPHLFSSWPA